MVIFPNEIGGVICRLVIAIYSPRKLYKMKVLVLNAEWLFFQMKLVVLYVD